MTDAKNNGALNRQTGFDALEERVLLIDGQFTHPNADRLKELRAVFAKCAQDVARICKGDPNVNVGRVIAAVDLLQQAKDTACCALLLPYAKTDPRVASDASNKTA
jgi:hypothetical protein